MQAGRFLNYRLKYCWPKVICCICQPNELNGKLRKNWGGANRGPSKNLGEPCPIQAPFRIATVAASAALNQQGRSVALFHALFKEIHCRVCEKQATVVVEAIRKWSCLLPVGYRPGCCYFHA